MTDCPICNGDKIGNIRNLKNYVASLWPHSLWNDCLGNGIKFSDLDGIVERNGKFLIIEGKGFDSSDKPIPIPTGQRRMFNNLAMLGCFTIIILWGHKPGIPEKYQFLWGQNGRIRASQIRECNLDTIKTHIATWYLSVNRT